MKTLKFLSLVCVLLIAGLTKSNAGGNDGLDKAYNQVNAQLKAMIRQIPVDKTEGIDKSAFLVLSFSVNDKHEMENIHVESSDDKLANYVKKALTEEKILVNPLLEGKSGQVSVQLSNES